MSYLEANSFLFLTKAYVASRVYNILAYMYFTQSAQNRQTNVPTNQSTLYRRGVVMGMVVLL